MLTAFSEHMCLQAYHPNETKANGDRFQIILVCKTAAVLWVPENFQREVNEPSLRISNLGGNLQGLIGSVSRLIVSCASRWSQVSRTLPAYEIRCQPYASKSTNLSRLCLILKQCFSRKFSIKILVNCSQTRHNTRKAVTLEFKTRMLQGQQTKAPGFWWPSIRFESSIWNWLGTAATANSAGCNEMFLQTSTSESSSCRHDLFTIHSRSTQTPKRSEQNVFVQTNEGRMFWPIFQCN